MSTLTTQPAWQTLQSLYLDAGRPDIRALKMQDAARNDALMFACGGLIVDCSAQAVSGPVLSGLLELARAQDVEAKRDAMLRGDIINITEGRAVLHTALRSRDTTPLYVDGHDVRPEIQATLARMERWSQAIRAGEWLGVTGKPIRHILHIGIGGSDLGVRLLARALDHLADGPKLYCVSNIDPADLDPLLATLPAEETLITVASKTFRTEETMTNAKAARMWMTAQIRGKTEAEICAQHFVALTANVDAAQAFGIPADRILPLWDWVGGRFSVWSAVGFPLAVTLGFAQFRALLDGAAACDVHFATAPLAQNAPVMMALCGIWNRNFLGFPALAVLPYAQPLSHLSDYLQQLDMESNGKSLTETGMSVDYETAPIVFGQPGTNGQHAFHQMLHQGPTPIPADFIGVCAPNGCPARHKALMAHFLAQGEALLWGKPSKGPDKCEGNRPFTRILLPALDAASLGALLALYEHKVAVQGWIWGINSFDQYGVELGKIMAKEQLAGADFITQTEALNLSNFKRFFTFSAQSKSES